MLPYRLHYKFSVQRYKKFLFKERKTQKSFFEKKEIGKKSIF